MTAIQSVFAQPERRSSLRRIIFNLPDSSASQMTLPNLMESVVIQTD